MATKPVGVPFNLPANYRQCDETAPTTDPSKPRSVGDLLVAYGVERQGRAEVNACLREAVRLIDVHNAAMTSGKLAAP